MPDFFNYRLGPSAISSVLDFMQRACEGELRVEKINRQKSSSGIKRTDVEVFRIHGPVIRHQALALLRENKTIREAAQICGCSHTTVHRWKQQFLDKK